MAPKRVNPAPLKKRLTRLENELDELSVYTKDGMDWVGPNADRLAQVSSDLKLAAMFVHAARLAMNGWKKVIQGPNGRFNTKTTYEE